MPGLGIDLTLLLDKVVAYKNNCGPATQTNEAFQYSVFWRDAEVVSQVLSKNFTQLALMFSQDPNPPEAEVRKVVNNVLVSLDNLLAVFSCVPKDQGEYFINKLWDSVKLVLNGMEGFLEALKKPKRNQKNLQPVGIFWDAVEMIPKLPRNNCEAVINALQREHDMLEDAVEEMKSTLREQKDMINCSEGVDGDMWSEKQELVVLQDVHLLTRLTLEFLKVSLVSVKKNGKTETAQQIKDLDNIGRVAIDKFSRSMDDVISTLYPPMDREAFTQCLSAHFELLDDYYKVLTGCHFMVEERNRMAGLIFNKIVTTKSSLNQNMVAVQLESLSVDGT